MPHRMDQSGMKGGFTLVETIVVMVLVALVAVIVVSRPMSTGATVAAERERLGELLRYTQLLAMANNVDVWSVDISSTGYTLQKNGAASGVNIPGERSDSYSFPGEVRVTSGAGALVFDEWGSPGNSSITITLSDGRYTRTLTIAATTGHQS